MSSHVYPTQISLHPTAKKPPVSVHLPGSKSITNRALLLAALADGESLLRAPLHSDDTVYMSQALRDLGAQITETPDKDFIVHGVNGAFGQPSKSTLFIGNSGTTVRFLTAAACLIPKGSDVVLDGVARMRERPIRDLLGALLMLGVQAESVLGHGCPPVRVLGGGMPGGECRLHGDVSSQFLSAVLQVAPYAEKDVSVQIIGDLISKPYVDITQSVMRAFGADFENDRYQHLTVKSGQRYEPRTYEIEADASNASYFMAAAAVLGVTVTLTNLSSDSIQGDVHFMDVLEKMGCHIERGRQLTITGPEKLRAVDADMTAIPDTAQTLAVVAAFADSPMRITGISSLRVKETDRVQAITTELSKLGVRIEEGRDYWIIKPPDGELVATAPIDTYDDHRMAMSFAVAGLRVPDLVINDPGCVAKTFPDFWERWNKAFY